MEDIKLKDILAASGFSFKKQFGQNFITDANLLAAIVEGAGVDGGSTVVEIGCGAGTLTAAIAARAKQVIAYEIDRDLAPVLARTLAGIENAEVVFRDFSRVNMAEFERSVPPYIVVANLPYYITTPLVMKFVEHAKKCPLAHRNGAGGGRRTLLRSGGHARIRRHNGGDSSARLVQDSKARAPHHVHAPPHVDSAVVRIDIREGNIAVKDAAVYKKVVRAAFASRRKTLENNLMQAFGAKRPQVRALLEGCGIDCMARGEQLTPQQFALLADGLTDLTKAADGRPQFAAARFLPINRRSASKFYRARRSMPPPPA